MSHVTDVILSIGLLEESDDAENPALIAEINTWLDEREKGTLARVDQFAGGRKASQATIYLGAFNYLPIDGLADFRLREGQEPHAGEEPADEPAVLAD